MVSRLKLGDIEVDVMFKDIRNVHLSVHPPTGRVRISAPARMQLGTIRVFAVSKLGWIKQQQNKLRGQERETRREYVDRESHYFWGQRYLLKIVQGDALPEVEVKHRVLLLRVRPGTDREKKQAIMEGWYREQIKKAAYPLISKWQPILRVKVGQVFVQRMKTKWGSCNIDNRSIRLNTHLAKKPRECLEYLVVHEMVHLLERKHNDQFKALMDCSMPHWRLYRDELNRAPLAYENRPY